MCQCLHSKFLAVDTVKVAVVDKLGVGDSSGGRLSNKT